jgi:hypothetical protein
MGEHRALERQYPQRDSRRGGLLPTEARTLRLDFVCESSAGVFTGNS